MADRGITSFQGRPADVDISTFYGNPADSHVRAGVDLGTATIEHKAGRVTLRNRTLYGDYDRFYQNYVPGAVNAGQEPRRPDRLQQRHPARERLQPDGRGLPVRHRDA